MSNLFPHPKIKYYILCDVFPMFFFSFEPILRYVDQQFENYLRDESGLNRRNIADTRVHCCFYFINPSGHGYVSFIIMC